MSLLVQGQELLQAALANLTGDLGAEQLELYDLALSEAELAAAVAGLGRCEQDSAPGDGADLKPHLLAVFAAEALENSVSRLSKHSLSLQLDPSVFEPFQHQVGRIVRTHLAATNLQKLGAALLDQPAVLDWSLRDDKNLMRDTFRRFTSEVVVPLAQTVHRENKIVPDEILKPLREMGCFGLSIPERFGGLQPDSAEDSLGMVVVTQELSRGSLGAAGSLITRPEIMARALLQGGTEEQKAHWLPQLASGDPLCAISVTEPDTGSDVAAVALKATQTQGGWLLQGNKTWCTFAGKASVLLVLARTDPAATPAHRGLSLFLVEKPSTDGHTIDYANPAGGQLSGRAIDTLGYRGMHSFEMSYDDFFVPDSHVIGGSTGLGKGFYYTMRGFMGGRLQTAARACGLMQAAFADSLTYGSERRVFGQPIDQFPLTQAKYVRMAAYLLADQAFAYEVADMMDAGKGNMEASLVKLLACKHAEWVCREALQIYGGMGYAEETAVSRYYVDARVLSIFEGAEETLAVRVVGKALLDAVKQVDARTQTGAVTQKA